MEETLKIQEEFESLIEQLERLRSINDITTANAESADKVITGIDSFIQSTQTYKESIEVDLKAKTDKMDTVLAELDKSVQKMEFEAQKLSSVVSASFNDFKEITQEEFHTDFLGIKDVFQNYISDISTIKSEFNTALTSHRTLSLEAIEISREETSNEIKKIKTEVSNGLMSHRALFLEAIEKSKTETLIEVRNVKNQFSNTTTQLSQTIHSLNNKLLEEQSKLHKSIELNKYLLIFNIIAVSAISILILF